MMANRDFSRLYMYMYMQTLVDVAGLDVESLVVGNLCITYFTITGYPE